MPRLFSDGLSGGTVDPGFRRDDDFAGMTMRRAKAIGVGSASRFAIAYAMQEDGRQRS